MIKGLELNEKVVEKKLFVSHRDGILTEVPENKAIYVNGGFAAIVTKKYQLTTNQEILDRLNDWSEKHGFDLGYRQEIATRRRGNNIFQNWFPFTIGDGFKVDSDEDDEKTHYSIAEIFNSYDGNMSWGTNVSGEIVSRKMFYYAWRLKCLNGMMGWKSIGKKDFEKTDDKKYSQEQDVVKRIAAEKVNRFRHIGDKETQFNKIILGFENQELVKETIENIYKIHTKTFFEVFTKLLPVRMAQEFEMFNHLKAFQLIQAITFYAKTKYSHNRQKYEKIQMALSKSLNNGDRHADTAKNGI